MQQMTLANIIFRCIFFVAGEGLELVSTHIVVIFADESIGESPKAIPGVGSTITISKSPIKNGTIVLKTADENAQKGTGLMLYAFRYCCIYGCVNAF